MTSSRTWSRSRAISLTKARRRRVPRCSSCTARRDAVIDYVASLHNSLTTYGDVAGSPGNFQIPVRGARLVFLDARLDGVNVSINDDQLAWLDSTNTTDTLAFFHIPLTEFQDAVDAGVPMSGAINEPVCDDLPNPNVFDALKRTGVVAAFVGHDHTNDF